MPEDIQCIQYVYTEYKYVDMSQVLFISGKHSCKHQKCLYVDGYKYLHRKGVYRYPTPLTHQYNTGISCLERRKSYTGHFLSVLLLFNLLH